MRKLAARTRHGSGVRREGIALCFLLACFIFAGVLGCSFAAASSQAQKASLSVFLRAYMTLFAEGCQPPSVWSVCTDFFLWPLLVLLAGVSSPGVALIPLMLAARGFLLSYAISSFYFTFGLPGIGAAAVVFGLTLCSVVPALFAVGCPAFLASAAALRGRGRSRPIISPCCLLLIPAAFLQWSVVPELMGRTAAMILFL